jgi:hypothetical protein
MDEPECWTCGYDEPCEVHPKPTPAEPVSKTEGDEQRGKDIVEAALREACETDTVVGPIVARYIAKALTEAHDRGRREGLEEGAKAVEDQFKPYLAPQFIVAAIRAGKGKE